MLNLKFNVQYSSSQQNIMNKDIHYMQRALALAKLGAGTVSPNPMVGCVIVHENRIIGEGWHERYGQPHAEVNAVASVKDKSVLNEATAYVTLEPCSHFGKTPPCADLLVKHQLKRVVICNDDPNPLVAGKGIQKLKDAGIEVETGLLAEVGREINKRFFTFFEKKRPYIILKWAMSSDGLIAKENYEAVQISNALSRRWVHKMRSEEDAIMVGTNTAQYDNPSLTTRFWTGKNPVRVILDKTLRLSPQSRFFDDESSTLCYNLKETKQEGKHHWIQLSEEKDLLESLIADLYQRKITSLIVEGGTTLLNTFLEKGLWDEAHVYQSQTPLGKGIAAPFIQNQVLLNAETIGDNRRLVYKAP